MLTRISKQRTIEWRTLQPEIFNYAETNDFHKIAHMLFAVALPTTAIMFVLEQIYASNRHDRLISSRKIHVLHYVMPQKSSLSGANSAENSMGIHQPENAPDKPSILLVGGWVNKIFYTINPP